MQSFFRRFAAIASPVLQILCRRAGFGGCFTEFYKTSSLNSPAIKPNRDPFCRPS